MALERAACLKWLAAVSHVFVHAFRVQDLDQTNKGDVEWDGVGWGGVGIEKRKMGSEITWVRKEHQLCDSWITASLTE